MNRSEFLRALFWKRGWRTYALGSVLAVGFAINTGIQDGPAPSVFFALAALGSAVYARFLWRRSRR